MPTHPAIKYEIKDSCPLSSNLHTHPCSYMTHCNNGTISNIYIFTGIYVWGARLIIIILLLLSWASILMLKEKKKTWEHPLKITLSTCNFLFVTNLYIRVIFSIEIYDDQSIKEESHALSGNLSIMLKS